VPELEDIARQKNDPVLSVIAKRQYLDWRELRHRDIHSSNVMEVVERFCAQICDALRRSWVSPEERRQQEAEAQRQAEDERQRGETEAKRRAAEETRQRVGEEERRKREAEIAQRRLVLVSLDINLLHLLHLFRNAVLLFRNPRMS
jgi:hypothetical protein